MNLSDYKAEHKRLEKVLKGAARELRLQRQEKPKMVSKCKMMNGMKMKGMDY